MKLHSFLFLATAAASIACGSTDDGAEKEQPGEQDPPPEEVPVYEPGITVESDQAVFQTAEYELEPGQEKFLCYTAEVGEDLTVETVAHEARSTLHHVIFAKTNGDEPAEYSECDTLFRLSWQPLYLAGAGKSELALPEGYAHRVPAGTQLLAQLHLLNSGTETVHDTVQIVMKRSQVEAPKPVAVYAFGNMNVNLPPSKESTLEGDCTLTEDVRLLAGFPHMHMLGTGLTFDVKKADGSAFERRFERTPYDFDNQHLDAIDVRLAAGDQTKVTCSYNNTTDHTITFGESTFNEMCFFVAIAADRDAIDGCFGAGNTPPADL
jgi:hypothetical protein